MKANSPGLFLFIILILSTKIGSAQTPLPPVNASVSINNGKGICFVELPDSTGWSIIEIQLKDLIKDTVLFSREYVFDQTTGLPSGISWNREGNNIYMGTDSLPQTLGWQGRVRLKNTSGQWSNAFEFLFQ